MSEISMGVVLGKPTYTKHATSATFYRLRMFAVTLLSDLGALLISNLITQFLVYQTLDIKNFADGELGQVFFVILCFSFFMNSRLYPGGSLNPAVEMKTVTQLAGLSFLIVFSFLVTRAPVWTPDKLVLMLVSALSVVTILGMRWTMRILAVQLELWGEPVIVVASKDKLEPLVGYFHERRRLGFVPAGGVADHLPDIDSLSERILDADGLSRLPDEYFFEKGIQTALVSAQAMSEPFKSLINQQLLRKFKRVIFIADMEWLEGVSLTYHDFEGILGMEARQKFLGSLDGLMKRMVDLLAATFLGLLSLPIFLLTALVIRLDSPGPIFYKQERLGKNRQKIIIYKFRTMYVNAENIFSAFLARSPEAQKEWNETQKLREDPRITPVGKFIRRFSIDELPQLFNILKGDMSIVGPRPIMLQQVKIYGEGIHVYASVRPGLTGFWQVSGRNRTSFHQRALYDVYYVRNWSIWLDIYILLRTVWVVVSRDGAY